MGKLRDEIITDPLARYAGLTAAQIHTSLYLTANRTVSDEVPATDILDVFSWDSIEKWMNTADVPAKSAWRLLELAILANLKIDVVGDPTFKQILVKARNAAPSAVITGPERNNAEALCAKVVTRAVELKLPWRDPRDIQRILDGEDV